jgi:hypothetical protein
VCGMQRVSAVPEQARSGAWSGVACRCCDGVRCTALAKNGVEVQHALRTPATLAPALRAVALRALTTRAVATRAPALLRSARRRRTTRRARLGRITHGHVSYPERQRGLASEKVALDRCGNGATTREVARIPRAMPLREAQHEHCRRRALFAALAHGTARLRTLRKTVVCSDAVVATGRA